MELSAEISSGKDEFDFELLVVINYVKYMGGVDRADQLASTNCFLGISLKWWRKLFFWGLEVCPYILYKIIKQQREEKLLHLQYVKTLQLIKVFCQTRARASTSTSDSEDIRLNGKLHNILKGVKKHCEVCSKRNIPDKRHQTTYYCNTCPEKPCMHLGNCFIKYHTKLNYKD